MSSLYVQIYHIENLSSSYLIRWLHRRQSCRDVADSGDTVACCNIVPGDYTFGAVVSTHQVDLAVAGGAAKEPEDVKNLVVPSSHIHFLSRFLADVQ